MFKLLKRFARPFIFVIILAIGLLSIQAMSDLALPDLMSKIVNVGIQQGGIENAIPNVIGDEMHGDISLLIAPDDLGIFEDSYSKVSKDDDIYDKYERMYTKLNGKDIYVLNTDVVDSDLEPIMTDLLIKYAYLVRSSGDAIFDKIAFMNWEARADIFGPIEEQIKGMDKAVLTGGAIKIVSSSYEELGLDIERLQQSYILKTGAVMLLITLVAAVCAIAVGLISSRVAAGMSHNIRKAVFSKVSNFTNNEFDKFSTASLLTRTTNDITKIQSVVVMTIRMVFYAPILGVGGVIKALESSSSMSWIIALAIIVLAGMIVIVFSIAMPRFKTLQKMVDGINRIIRENLSGLMVIRAFNGEGFEEKRFDEANKNYTKKNLFINRIMVVMMPFMTLVLNAVTLIIVWIGAHEIAASNMKVGDMMAFMQYAMQIIMAFLMLSYMFIMLPMASVSAVRIAEVLNVKPSIVDSKSPKKLNKSKDRAKVVFDNVSFKYPGAEEPMLKNISFTAPQGKVTAIIGPTGSGKSTLLNLIPRFYDTTEGEVIVSGRNVKDVSQYDLRDSIGYIPQKATLFTGTIADNLMYGNEEASVSDLESATEIAQAMPFIEDKEDRFKEKISQGGTNVSGGQRQRLSIARALMKKPDIYLFDDSFSALDFATDANLRKALKAKVTNSTMIIVAQRISTIKDADQIIVLDEGNMVGIGKHDELLKTCQTYKEIAESQLAKGEL